MNAGVPEGKAVPFSSGTRRVTFITNGTYPRAFVTDIT